MKRSFRNFVRTVFALIMFDTVAYADALTGELSLFRSDLQKAALQYFIDHTNSVTGLVRDRARNFGNTPDRDWYQMSSIAATGFGMAVTAHACIDGTFDCREARMRISRTLQYAYERLPHYHGWLYHFLDWNSGQPLAGTEASTVDTAWFLGGALYAGQVLADDAIGQLANQLYRRVDFIDMMTDGGKFPEKRTLSMGWLPDHGYITADWDSYAEHMFLVLLGLGHPDRPIPVEAWSAWQRPKTVLPDGTAVIGAGLPLFAHQYTQLFVDMRDFKDSQGEYFLNSRRATQANRAYCVKATQSRTYAEGLWGLSASDSSLGYYAFSISENNGTVCPACAGASAMFAPVEILPQLRQWAMGPYKNSLIGRYGFVDSLNLDQRWFDDDVIGITVGALYLSLANTYDQNAPWNVLTFYPPIARALQLASTR